MTIGLSIYSLYKDIIAEKITALEAIDLIADYGADHVELVEFVVNFAENPAQIEEVVKKCAARDLEISAYSIGGNVLEKTKEEYEEEIQRIKSHIDIAEKLGTKVMRTDLARFGRPTEMNVIENFEKDLPTVVEACQRFADYAKPKGITITVENHGTYINGGDRVRRLITQVDRDNFRCTLDVGNSLSVDEDPIVCVKTLLPYAETIHFKDFLVRRAADAEAIGAEGPATFKLAQWMPTSYGNYIRGTIVGDGDVEVVRIMEYIKDSGYDGTVSIEFEGPEECQVASQISLENVKRYAGVK